MTSRPKEFDARVMAYTPGLHKLAKRYRHRLEDQSDLVTDTIIYALGAWQTFREDGGMWSWLSFCMRGVVSNQAKKAAARKGMRFVALTTGAEALLYSEPSQEHHAELVDAMARLRRIKGGTIVLRRALGHKLREIADRKGISTTRVEQIESAARAKLKKAA
ncbi:MULTISPECIES: sigma-70 family RNA polymerase sigma factor [unclassified Mesorhizobium]|uniref:sigma-70 family RNA polymerase sigma factor n=1 Tax=unclassified Mesorhizobium TaxID=325217 RepID=UPI0003CF76F1|nr:sigma-70 family RNA polymerase sigma factor [Mesorhizobium sp. LSHC414A00]ESX78491.1 hypothetical protein X757_09125 [Mesorhizobium sp. LSHC414A00]